MIFVWRNYTERPPTPLLSLFITIFGNHFPSLMSILNDSLCSWSEEGWGGLVYTHESVV